MREGRRLKRGLQMDLLAMARSAEQLVVRGRVQGVGYRWWTVETARRLGLSGWVRNRRDGAVEIVAIGEAGAIERLAQACRLGPRSAMIDDIDRRPAEDDGTIGFDARETFG